MICCVCGTDFAEGEEVHQIWPIEYDLLADAFDWIPKEHPLHDKIKNCLASAPSMEIHPQDPIPEDWRLRDEFFLVNNELKGA